MAVFLWLPFLSGLLHLYFSLFNLITLCLDLLSFMLELLLSSPLLSFKLLLYLLFYHPLGPCSPLPLVCFADFLNYSEAKPLLT